MRVRKVNRYYCDYCSTSKGTRRAMARHESRCTANPNRECGLCDYVERETGESQRCTLDELRSFIYMEFTTPEMLSDESVWQSGLGFLEHRDGNRVLQQMRNMSGCPACMFAAIRITGAPLYINLKKEMRSVLDEFNADIGEGPLFADKPLHD